MPEAQIVLIYILSAVLVMLAGGLAFYAMSSAKSRIIREQKKALEAEQQLRRAQESFTDNAHHELRTPVQILQGHLQMLRDLDPTPEQADLLAHAQEATAHLDRLVQDLLDLSSLAQGNLTPRVALTDLGPHLARLARGFEKRAAAKGLAAQVALDTLPHPLVCDEARLSQALEALLDNALGFTEQGTISFRMSAQPEGPTWHLRFEIEDEGPGLPPDWQRLLHPFAQEEQGFRRRRNGLGIGLPLAAGLIESMGGTMGLEPLATGTLAWVELRLESANMVH